MTRSLLRNSTPSRTTVPSSGTISLSSAVLPPTIPRPMMRLPSAGSSFSRRFQPPPWPLPPKPPPFAPPNPPPNPPAALSSVCFGFSAARFFSTSRYSRIERSISCASLSRNERIVSSSSASSFSNRTSISKPSASFNISRNFCATFSFSCSAATRPSTGHHTLPARTAMRFSMIVLVMVRYDPLRMCTMCGTYSLAASSAGITRSR